jgi:uncharacterized phage infection (PIP) family protein YhgE
MASSFTTPGQGLTLEPVSGGSNSLDQFIRSIEGITGTQGQGILGTGGSTIGQGQGITQTGLQQANSGITALAPALSYLTALTKGDQGDVTQAAQPQIDQITQQFDAIRNMISMQPRGGGKATALAEAPFAKSAAIQRTEGDMRTGAATSLGNLGSQLANIGLGTAGVGLGESGVGISEAGLGAGLENTSANIALGKQGLDYGQPSTLQQVLSAVNTLF